MMVFRLNTMLKGHSGVTRDLVEQLKLYINKRIIPVVPEQGSLVLPETLRRYLIWR